MIIKHLKKILFEGLCNLIAKKNFICKPLKLSFKASFLKHPENSNKSQYQFNWKHSPITNPIILAPKRCLSGHKSKIIIITHHHRPSRGNWFWLTFFENPFTVFWRLRCDVCVCHKYVHKITAPVRWLSLRAYISYLFYDGSFFLLWFSTVTGEKDSWNSRQFSASICLCFCARWKSLKNGEKWLHSKIIALNSFTHIAKKSSFHKVICYKTYIFFKFKGFHCLHLIWVICVGIDNSKNIHPSIL